MRVLDVRRASAYPEWRGDEGHGSAEAGGNCCMRVSSPSARTTIPAAPLTTPDAWEGPEMAARGDWKRVLSQTEITELLEACEHATKSGKSMYAWTRQDFPLS